MTISDLLQKYKIINPNFWPMIYLKKKNHIASFIFTFEFLPLRNNLHVPVQVPRNMRYFTD